MHNQSILKLLFCGFSAIVIALTCTFTLLIEETPSPESSSNFKGIELTINEIIGENVSLKYLWRPNVNLIEDLDTLQDCVFSDRIGAQLEWTKKLFQSKSVNNLPMKNILLIFGPKGGRFWGTGNKINCPGFKINTDKCKLTLWYSQKRPLSIRNYDAVIYTQDYRRSSKISNVPFHEKEVVYTEEPPYRLTYKLGRHTLFSSYYRGSDIVSPYSKWVSYNDPDAEYFNIRKPHREKTIRPNHAKRKSRFAVIFMSNCDNVNNNRFQYITELKKYIPLDIFGGCGKQPKCKNKASRQCIDAIVKKYKFYLAFENSNCRHYITEKFFSNALQNDAIPIVLGAHPNDYRYAAPPNSYIHVQDFETPEKLAEYLIYLYRNNTMYNKYFQWKGTGQFYNSWRDLFCRICGMLFYSYFIPPPERELNFNWNAAQTCLPKGQWYWESVTNLSTVQQIT